VNPEALDARPDWTGEMSSASWVRDRRRLEQELRDGCDDSLLQILKHDHPFLRQFATWEDVVAFMRRGSSRDPRKNGILFGIFRAHQEDRDPRWRTILMVIFWPALRAIHRRKAYWDSKADERWQNVLWAFLEVVCRIDVSRRSEGLVQKVVNDTFHGLRGVYRREWDWLKRTVALEPEEDEDRHEYSEKDRFGALVGGQEAIEFAEVDLRHDQEAEIKRLRRYVSKGFISEADFFLIVGTRLYGASLSQYASDHGLDYETAKKRRQRAEAKLRRHYRKRL
jgi:hypothetical protein